MALPAVSTRSVVEIVLAEEACIAAALRAAIEALRSMQTRFATRRRSSADEACLDTIDAAEAALRVSEANERLRRPAQTTWRPTVGPLSTQSAVSAHGTSSGQAVSSAVSAPRPPSWRPTLREAAKKEEADEPTKASSSDLYKANKEEADEPEKASSSGLPPLQRRRVEEELAGGETPEAHDRTREKTDGDEAQIPGVQNCSQSTLPLEQVEPRQRSKR